MVKTPCEYFYVEIGLENLRKLEKIAQNKFVANKGSHNFFVSQWGQTFFRPQRRNFIFRFFFQKIAKCKSHHLANQVLSERGPPEIQYCVVYGALHFILSNFGYLHFAPMISFLLAKTLVQTIGPLRNTILTLFEPENTNKAVIYTL